MSSIVTKWQGSLTLYSNPTWHVNCQIVLDADSSTPVIQNHDSSLALTHTMSQNWLLVYQWQSVGLPSIFSLQPSPSHRITSIQCFKSRGHLTGLEWLRPTCSLGLPFLQLQSSYLQHSRLFCQLKRFCVHHLPEPLPLPSSTTKDLGLSMPTSYERLPLIPSSTTRNIRALNAHLFWEVAIDP